MSLAAKEPDHGTGELILVADSDEAGRHQLTNILERAGFAVVEATNGEDALERLARTHASAAVIDLHLPDRAAFEVIRRVRANPATRTLPTLLVAGGDDVFARIAALDAGATDFLPKPFHHQELLARLNTHLRAVDVWHITITERLAQRNGIARALARLGTNASLETASSAVCDELDCSGSGAAIVVFTGDGAVAVGAAGVSAWGVQAPETLPAAVASYLRERAGRGPWIEHITSALPAVLPAGGTEIVACAPIGGDHRVDGVLVLGVEQSSGRATTDDLSATLSNAIDHAESLTAVLGHRLHTWSVEHQHCESLEHLIRERRFTPAFQPIRSLIDLTVVGHEALTRFHDGAPPAARFREAVALGAGIELELATLSAAVTAARQLPDGEFISLNVSPAFLSQSETVAAQLADCDRLIVLELTEHDPIDNYPAVREALAHLRPATRLSIDDAGSGFASLRHIVELEPDYIKLDRTWVDGIDRDPSRQALVAGLSYFTQTTGAQLVAEGIERPEELEILSELGVQLGQGFLLGRPAIQGTPA